MNRRCLLLLGLILLAPLLADAEPSIEEVRTLCETLTNENIREIDGHAITKRKDLLLHHAQGLCEQLELYFDENQLSSPEAKENLKDLHLIHDSWVHKFQIEDGLGLIDILFMGIYHDLSPWLLRYDIPSNASIPETPKDSIFWKKLGQDRGKYFEQQAAYQKIDPDITIVQLEELEAKGSAPKAHVKSLKDGARWLLKWGDEVHTDPVASRLFAALGFNVDHPYFLPAGKITLLLGDLPNKKKRTVQHFVRFLYNAFSINLSPFILKGGKINKALLRTHPEWSAFKGQYFIQFRTASMEARPSSELRLGGIMSSRPDQYNRRELRGALLAHLWLNSWDTKEDNTLLSISRDPQGLTAMTGSYSDLGISLGVSISKFPRDVKAGLVNSFSWDLVEKANGQIRFHSHINYFSKAYREATFEDLRWMATEIAEIDAGILRASLLQSGWPDYLQDLYFYKLAERRRQILAAFEISDPHPIEIKRNFSYEKDGIWLVKDGELIVEPSLEQFPEGLLNQKGRFRGLGW